MFLANIAAVRDIITLVTKPGTVSGAKSTGLSKLGHN
jgi:hypothetical protein